MAVIRISEADAARDFAGLMAHARLGAEVVIENEARAVAVVRPAVPAGPGRPLSELIAAAESRSPPWDSPSLSRKEKPPLGS